jgi:hypothetical protein
VISLCARPKAMIYNRHLRKSVALSYRSVAGQLDKIHVLEAEEFLRKNHVTLSLRVRVLREPFVPQGTFRSSRHNRILAQPLQADCQESLEERGIEVLWWVKFGW